MTEHDKPKKKSYTKHVLIVGLAMIVSFWIASYIVASDPKVEACFKLAEELQVISSEDQGITDRLAEKYTMFLEQCDFMINMEEQRESNPELHEWLQRNE